MSEKVILALDQGTTSSRAILFDKRGEPRGLAQKDFRQIFPQPGWVEHDPCEIWDSQIGVARELVAQAAAGGLDVVGLGITNQRETTLVWERATGAPIYNAIVWQDRRTAKDCDALRAAGHVEKIRQKTGLVLDAYFSATKLKWILDHVPQARERAARGELCFGTVDTWLVWNLTRGACFITDLSNASRTMLFNIHTLEWDEELLALFEVPRAMLPELRENSEVYCETAAGVFPGAFPIAGLAGDQHAALFGQLCLAPGMVKTTYGTGCFLMMNTGGQPVISQNKLLTTVAWKLGGEVSYALEGSVFVGGAAIQWLRDGLKVIDSAEEVNALAASVTDSGGLVFVPALTGLAAPHWDAYARGTILGITRGTTAGHIARATLEGIALQVCDIVKAMEADAGTRCAELRVDGGASASDLLMQIQCDLLGFKTKRPKTRETTALGAAYLAGLALGVWTGIGEIQTQWSVGREFAPQLPREQAEKIARTWQKAVARSRDWATE